MLALNGVLSVLLGAMLTLAPGAGALAVVWWTGATAIVFGVLTILLGMPQVLRRA